MIALACAAAASALPPTSAHAAAVVSTWKGSTGLWSASGNWTNVPAQGGFPHNTNAGVPTYDAVINAGTVTLDRDIAIQKLTLAGGTLTGGRNLTLNEPSTWGAATISGTGTLTLREDMNLSAGNRTLTQRTINNFADVSWNAGAINSGQGAVFNNSGRFYTYFGGAWDHNQGGAVTVFNNSGEFVRQYSSARTTFNIPFNNTGTVRVESGTLVLAGGGQASGYFDSRATQPSLVEFAGDYALRDGLRLLGQYRLSSGTLTVTGDVSAGVFEIAGGALSGLGHFRAGRLVWSGGAMTGGGLTSVSDASLGGYELILSGGTKTFTRRTINNHGTTSWSAGAVSSGMGATFNNNNSGIFEAYFDGTWNADQGGDAPAFNNAGQFFKTGGTGPLTFFSEFNNMLEGLLTINTGRLVLAGGGRSWGAATIAPGASIDFASSNYSLEGSAGFSGNGAARLLSGNLALNGIHYAQRFELSGGTLGGGGPLNIYKALTWSGGAMAGTGTTSIHPGALASFDGGDKTLTARTISNDGVIDWTAGPITAAQGARLLNNGTVNATADLALTFAQGEGTPSTFDNLAHFNKSAGPGVTTLAIPFNNDGLATIAAGRLDITGGGAATGAFDIRPNTELRITANYDFQPASSISGGGTFRANSGVASIGGAYDVATTSIDNATLNFSPAVTPNTRTLLTDNLLFNTPGARLNLNNNSAAINYPDAPGASPLAAIRAKLQSGYAAGAWNGNGILSTFAAHRPGAALAYAEASTLLGISGTQTASFNGHTIDATTLIIEYTLRGDTNLDQIVNFPDLVSLAQNYNNNTGNATWQMGDSDYDGNVTFPDLVALAQNYADTLPTAGHFPPSFESDLAKAFTQVPEPTPLLPTALALSILNRRRRPSHPKATNSMFDVRC